MPPHQEDRKGPQTEKYTADAVSRISPANRAFAQDFIQLRHNEGLKAKSVHSYAIALLHADRLLGGRPMATATPKDWMGVVSHFRATMKPSTVFAMVYQIRRAVRDLLDVDKLPKDVDKALYVKPVRETLSGRLISEAEFHQLLETSRAFGNQMGTLPRSEKSQAILWTLWDSGFRAEELLGLNVGDVKFDGHRGAKIALRPDAPNLKTGPRTIYVSECVGSLRAWLELHPAGHDAKAPLFPGFRDRTGYRRMDYQRLLHHLNTLGEASGVNAASSREKKVSPHDFRHTCATRKAKAGWMEAELRAYFGWSAGSHMPSLYVHLSLGDMRERVRRDAGIDETGYSETLAANDPAQALTRLVQQLAQQKPGAMTRTRKPGDWERR